MNIIAAETKVITAHIPIPLAEKVEQIANRLERPKGWIIKQALISWVDQEEERNRLTQEAMIDVDLGNIVSHQAVEAWADSLNADNPLPIPYKL